MRQLKDAGPWMKRSSRTHPVPSQASEPAAIGEATAALLLQDEPSSGSLTTAADEDPVRTGSSKRRLLNLNENTSVNLNVDVARDEEVQSPSRSYSPQMSQQSTPKPILRNGEQTVCVEFGCHDSPSRRLSWRDLHTNESLTEVSHYEPRCAWRLHQEYCLDMQEPPDPPKLAAHSFLANSSTFYLHSETGYSDDERKADQAACCVIS
jgi:hypothetical protein